MTGKWVVIVTAGFSTCVVYGPFKTFEEAAAWIVSQPRCEMEYRTAVIHQPN